MMEMEKEPTLGDIFEEIAERLAEARTHALMGERQMALGMLHAASLEYQRFRDVLQAYPGYQALEYSYEATMRQLCAEQSSTEEPETDVTTSKLKTRRKAVRAA